MHATKDSILAGDDFTNAQLQDVVFDRLDRSGHLGLKGISVKVDNHRVVLSGTVNTYYLKQIAQETARQACPHHRVLNRLGVRR